MKFKFGITDVNINIDKPGIYIFECVSATGKTKLHNLISNHMIYDNEVVASAYTYNDKLRNIDISTIFKGDYKLIVLDRYDMYYGYGSEYIKKFKDKAIILIDCKQDFNICEYEDLCSIELKENSIEVE